MNGNQGNNIGFNNMIGGVGYVNPNTNMKQPPIPFNQGNTNRIKYFILEIIASGQKFVGTTRKSL